jgi:hypothetical protein
MTDQRPLLSQLNIIPRSFDATRDFYRKLGVASREAVDKKYAELTAAGHNGCQPPYDAFWGVRYAIVSDPDGNDVGLMSPMDEKRRTWPPIESRAP